MVLYWILLPIIWVLAHILWRFEVIGRENLKTVRDGRAYVIAPNHIANLDPVFIAITVFDWKRLRILAKEELFKPAICGWIISQLYAFPVKRGAADRAAIKTAIGILKQGLCLGVFPEGHRSKDGKLGKAEAGVSLLAAMSKAPVIPTAIIGTNKIFANGGLLPKLQIIFGEPMFFEGKHNDKAALEDFSKKIMENIEKLIISHSQL